MFHQSHLYCTEGFEQLQPENQHPFILARKSAGRYYKHMQREQEKLERNNPTRSLHGPSNTAIFKIPKILSNIPPDTIFTSPERPDTGKGLLKGLEGDWKK